MTARVDAPHGRRAEYKLTKEAREAQRAERDPCSYCGVRGDYGCRHRRREREAA